MTDHLIINVGDALTGIDSKILILDHDSEADKYVVDIFSVSGDLVEHNRSVDGDLVRTIFRKPGSDRISPF